MNRQERNQSRNRKVAKAQRKTTVRCDSKGITISSERCIMNATVDRTDEKQMLLPQEQSVPTDKALVRLKLGMALLVGLITVAAGCLTGIDSLRQPHSWVCLPQRHTVWVHMQRFTEYLNEYKEQNGVYPLTMEEMINQWKKHEGKSLEERGINYRIQDAWKNPMIYSSNGKTWEILSYGADGKPGGVGLDTDIHCTDTSKPKFDKDLRPTFEQILRSKEFKGTAVLSVFLGIVSLIYTLSQLFSSKNPVKALHTVILFTIVNVIVTVFFVVAIVTFVSVASGH
jgi:general secretion pathway protein G